MAKKIKPYRDSRGRFAKRPIKSVKLSKKKPDARPAPRTAHSSGASFLGRYDIFSSGAIRNWWRIDFGVGKEKRRRHDSGRGSYKSRLYFADLRAIVYACERENVKARAGDVLVRGYAHILFRDKNEQWSVATPTLFSNDASTPEELRREIDDFVNKYAVQSLLELNLAFEPIKSKEKIRHDKPRKKVKKGKQKLRGSRHRKLARRKSVAHRHKLAKRKRTH